ncbi:MAG: LPS export ABC transporter periplasmic protein LptC, partial [Pseudomonadota bacterium]
ITLVLLVAGHWWQTRFDDQLVAPLALQDQAIDYALTDFTAEFFNLQGELDLIVQAPKLEHRADTRQAHIDEPIFTLVNQAPTWHGEARTALIDRNLEQIELAGQVVARRAHENGEIQVESDRIRYDRNSELLHSPGPARLSQPGTELRGDTLTVWLNEQRAELEHDVQGTYRRIAGDGPIN